MKKLLLTLSLFAFFSVAHAEGVSQKVCHEKNGKQVCKMVKVHKKLEGTEVPAKPAKPTKKK
jgi:hypothetical protein